MKGTYPVLLGNEVTGEATVERKGLYYEIDCRCRLHSGVVCRVTVEVQGHHENLGILVPDGAYFTLIKKLPVKLFGEGIPEFRIRPKPNLPEGVFIDVYPEEPFAYIAKLENAYLEVRRGRPGILLSQANRK